MSAAPARLPARPTGPGRGALDGAASGGSGGWGMLVRRGAITMPSRRPLDDQRSAGQLGRDAALPPCPPPRRASLLVPRARDATPLTGRQLWGRAATLARRGATATPSRCRLDEQRSRWRPRPRTRRRGRSVSKAGGDVGPQRPMAILPLYRPVKQGAALWMRQSPEKVIQPQCPRRPRRPERLWLLTASISLFFAPYLITTAPLFN